MSELLQKNDQRLTITMTGDRVLVKRIKTSDRTKSGLHTPESAKREHVISQVITCSPDMLEAGYGGIRLSPGQVIVTRAAGMPVPATLVFEDVAGEEPRAAYEIDEDVRYIVRASDVIAIYARPDQG